jgi:membrane protein YqaA with SNARE-associated domain
MGDPVREDAGPVTEMDRDAAEAPVGPVARWAIHRRLYDWVLSFAHRKHSATALFLLSFSESSFFPVPPDVLLAPLCIGKRDRAWRFASVTTGASVLGGVAGYAIGWGAWEWLHGFVYRYIPGFTPEQFEHVKALYDERGVIVLFVAAFTPVPYKVFTIAGGVFGQPLLPFVLVSLIGRGMRFFLVAGLFYWIGPRATPWIDRYFNLLCIAFVVLLVGGFAIAKWCL